MESQFNDEVLPAELEEIQNRRRAQNLPTPDLSGPPSVKKELTGLALSGGGIRSASLSLGVIQSLVKLGYFRSIDYLSTVSGGGYVGSCVSSTLNDKDTKESAFENLDGAEDTPAVNHLRNSSNFLISAALVDKLRLPTIFLRGILLNIWLIIPVIVLAVFLTEVLSEIWHLLKGPTMSPFILAIPAVVLALLFPVISRVFNCSFDWRKRDFYEKALAGLFGFSILSLLLVPVLWLVSFCIDNNWDESIARFFQNPSEKGRLLQLGIGIGGIVILGVLIRVARFFPVFTRVALNLLVTIMGPLLIFGTYLIFCIFFVKSPYFENELALESPSRELVESLETLNLESYSDILKYLRDKGPEKLSKEDAAIFDVLADELTHNATKVLYSKDLTQNPVKKGITISQDGRLSWEVSNGTGGSFNVETREHGYLYIPKKSIFSLDAEWTFYAVGFVIFLLNFFFFDANVTSTHGFYRDRLSRAFLFRVRSGHSVEPNDAQKLSDLNTEGSVAPYHLINTTLNLPASSDVGLRGRNADFFMLSKHYCGSEKTGYSDTKDIEEIDPHMNLGSAMAISAGAAAPSMGTATKKMLVFIMTLLNIRLGYWIPNPLQIVPGGRLRKTLLPNVGPGYLLKEALGKLNASSAHVNLSDGGHIENLAIYQLLRRRCKLIIAVDAEADPLSSFTGLVTLIRYARIDLGIRIDLQLDDLDRDEFGVSKSHWILATIHYGEDEEGEPEVGHLLYLKSSLTGDENEYVKSYQKVEPTFPHQTTADQFFDETQFEVYRSLGEHIARAALTDPDVEGILPSSGCSVV